jgi:hypothetical protein
VRNYRSSESAVPALRLEHGRNMLKPLNADKVFNATNTEPAMEMSPALCVMTKMGIAADPERRS